MGEVIQSVEFERQGRKRAETSEREQLTTPRFTDVVSSEKTIHIFLFRKIITEDILPSLWPHENATNDIISSKHETQLLELDLEQANMV